MKKEIKDPDLVWQYMKDITKEHNKLRKTVLKNEEEIQKLKRLLKNGKVA